MSRACVRFPQFARLVALNPHKPKGHGLGEAPSQYTAHIHTVDVGCVGCRTDYGGL